LSAPPTPVWFGTKSNLAEAVLPKSGGHAIERSGIPEFRVQLGVGNDIVAMRAAGPGPQIGRTVHVAHTEFGEIRRERRNVVEAELPID
jgi:hypothetical protein